MRVFLSFLFFCRPVHSYRLCEGLPASLPNRKEVKRREGISGPGDDEKADVICIEIGWEYIYI